MKTSLFSNKISVLTLLACLLILNTCKKDEDTSSPKYRVIASTDFSDNVQSMSNQMIYQNDKLTEVLGYTYDIKEDSIKTLVVYPDNNSIVATGYSKVGGAWLPDSKVEYEFQSDLLTQIIFYSSFEKSLEPFLKYSFQYQSSKITEERVSLFDSLDWFDLQKVTYSYEGNNFKQAIHSANWTGSWAIAYKEVVTYTGNEIDSILQSDYYDNGGGGYVDSYKYKYHYTNGLIARIDMFAYDGSSSWLPDGSWNFTYDANGNLISMSNQNSSGTEKTDYIYEEGKGNLGQIYFMSGGIADQVMPMPTKSSRGFLKDIDKYLAKKME